MSRLAPVNICLKTDYLGAGSRCFFTTPPTAPIPKGPGAPCHRHDQGSATTYQQHGNNDGNNVTDWWRGTLPALPSGTVLRYKIGTFSSTAASVFPSDANSVALKKLMETRFQITNFNATTATYHPHNDYGPMVTGLTEGFHVLRTRAIPQPRGPDFDL